MPPFLGFVPWIACGGLMWFVAHLLAPVGRDIPLSKGLLAVFLITGLTVGSNAFLEPLIGLWSTLVVLVLSALSVMGVMELSFWRSTVAVLVYWGGHIGWLVGVELLAGK